MIDRTNVDETPSVEHLLRVEGLAILVREDEGAADLGFPDFSGRGFCSLLGLYFALLLLKVVV